MQITSKEWLDYVTKLSSINKKASTLLNDFIQVHGTEDMYPIIDYAYALVNRYGGASSELACQLYDELAKLQNANVISAVPAELPDKSQIARAINGTKNQLNGPSDAIGRLVKKSASDTMIQNAKRDGAEYAWINHGDSCVYCKYLSSFGWLHANLNNGNHYLGHIHNNCDCEFAIRFDGKSTVEGYDPDRLSKEIDDAEGDTIEEKLNNLRRKQYGEIKDDRNARRRELYAKDKHKIEYPDGNVVYLSKEEARSLNRYISSESYPLNEALRDRKRLSIGQEKLVKDLDSALEKLPKYEGNLSRSVYFYGDKEALKFFNNLKVGGTYSEKSYLSTTTSEELYNPEAKVQIFISNSKKGCDITPINKSESEVLYERGTEFTVLDKVSINDKYYISLEEK